MFDQTDPNFEANLKRPPQLKTNFRPRKRARWAFWLKLAVAVLAMIIGLGTASPVTAAKKRVSILYIHYSVGTSMVIGYCWDPQYNKNITVSLDTMNVTYDGDTADIVFRSYRINDEGSLSSLSDTCPADAQGCGFNRFSGFTYDLLVGKRVKIWNSWSGMSGNAYAGILDHFFNVPDKENQTFWKMFKTHKTPSGFADSVTEVDGYDLVIIKNPYACWYQMSQAQSDSIKVLYRALRDSIVNHPEINVALAFGTPLRLEHYDAGSIQLHDSAQAKIIYDLASWFASDAFFTHTNNGIYKNIWKWDSFRPLCELGNVANKYCLKTEYHAGDGGSHLSRPGYSTAQDSLLSFIRRAARDILIQRSGQAMDMTPPAPIMDLGAVEEMKSPMDILYETESRALLPNKNDDIYVTWL